MFEWVGQTIQGGWDAVSNVVSTVGKGASGLVSGFFPTPQYTTIKSEIVESANTLGQPFRIVDPDSPSMFESYNYAANQWLNSPYEGQFAVETKSIESQNLDAMLTGGKSGSFDVGLDAILRGGEYVVSEAAKITTVADQLGSLWNRISTIFSGKKEIGNSPGTVTNVAVPATSGADTSVVSQWLAELTGGVANFLGQAKGLFNLGYSNGESQAAFTVKHELQPTKTTTIGLVVAGVVILFLFLLLRKKK